MTALDYTPKTVLCVGAHMDDLDCHAGGLIAQMAASGARVYYFVLTDGTLGSADPEHTTKILRRQRHNEQIAASRVFGIKWVYFGGFRDGRLADQALNPALNREIVRYIRFLRPDLVLTLDPTPDYYPAHNLVNHSDHRAAGRATLDAVNHLADNPRYHPDLGRYRGDQPLAPHAVSRILLATLLPDARYTVDISAQLDLKIKGVHEHNSQNGNALERLVVNWATVTGAAHGLEYAEAYHSLVLR